MSLDKAGKSTREPGRPQKQLSPEDGPLAALAQALRDLREASGNPTYRSLEKYAGIPHQRLAEAARGERLPAWAVVEGYLYGCRASYQHRPNGRPPLDGAGDLARWQQLYRDAGGALPARGQCGDTTSEPLTSPAPAPGADGPGPSQVARLHRAPRPSRRFNRRLVLTGAAAAGIMLLTGAGVMIGVSLGSGQPSPAAGSTPRSAARPARTAGISVAPPAPACGDAASVGFRSPATTAFSNRTTAYTLSLDGFSVSLMQGTYGGTSYYWVEAHPTGRRAGMQLRWSSQPNEWYYCTATLEAGSISALPSLVATMAIPATIHSRFVLYQACMWHQHPYSARCSPVSP